MAELLKPEFGSNKGSEERLKFLEASLAKFEEINHKKAVCVILTSLIRSNPEDQSLHKRHSESLTDLMQFTQTIGMRKSCYRKRHVCSNEALSILCELPLPT